MSGTNRHCQSRSSDRVFQRKNLLTISCLVREPCRALSGLRIFANNLALRSPDQLPLEEPSGSHWEPRPRTHLSSKLFTAFSRPSKRALEGRGHYSQVQKAATDHVQHNKQQPFSRLSKLLCAHGLYSILFSCVSTLRLKRSHCNLQFFNTSTHDVQCLHQTPRIPFASCSGFQHPSWNDATAS